MDETSQEEVELERLQGAYRDAVEEVMTLEVNPIARFARPLEVEARFLGKIEAAREAVERRRGRAGTRQH